MFNFLSDRFCSPFCFLAFSLVKASCTTRGGSQKFTLNNAKSRTRTERSVHFSHLMGLQ